MNNFLLIFLYRKIDVIFDCAGSSNQAYKNTLKNWENAIYISLNSPLLSSTDKSGLLCGILDTAKTLLEENIQSLTAQGSTNRWGYFMINPIALKKITEYVELGRVSFLLI